MNATDLAEAVARRVLATAREQNGNVVTQDLVDTTLSQLAGQKLGAANTKTVCRLIRQQASGTDTRIILTASERYWAIREQLYHMSPADVLALADSIADRGDRDPRGWDSELVKALATCQSGRRAPNRLRSCQPVSIRLWREVPVPTVEDVVDAPHAVYEGDERVHEGIPAAHVRTIVGNLRFKRADFTQSPDGSVCFKSRRYVPQVFHMRTVNGGTPERIDSSKAMREISNAQMKPGKQAVREMSASGRSARILYRDVRGEVVLRPATEDEARATVKPESERYTPGDLVIVRPVAYDPEKRQHRVLAEFLGTIVNWSRSDSRYNVRMLEADEHGHRGTPPACQDPARHLHVDPGFLGHELGAHLVVGVDLPDQAHGDRLPGGGQSLSQPELHRAARGGPDVLVLQLVVPLVGGLSVVAGPAVVRLRAVAQRLGVHPGGQVDAAVADLVLPAPDRALQGLADLVVTEILSATQAAVADQ
ncbi:hypothetical protein ACFWP3_37800 [Streptomyces sp. NPDC058525]|uniref:hypothetical protein n=1 Tax=Streptomyces sp. NPDC058525 TaxID=3346538 RepID=UPI0036602F84